MMSASFAASLIDFTVSPAFLAFSHEAPPSLRPTRTSMPLSDRFRAWACPWLPYPMIAIFFAFKEARSASFS